ncbi:hypothetical protein F4781DRAFT_397638 [Annulohypoxylon bovei var. microspora]|nr:hypothetical protein F4781DRAFT_397638 [Annulohypoxylon bovei var. microspora]
MSGNATSRRLGLLQVYPDPIDENESNKKDVDIIAIHGLDTHSPKTWVAWLKDGDPTSDEVNWLQDEKMLPSVVGNARIFTYDWNANFDKDAEDQSLTGHAKVLLNKLHYMRNKYKKRRPIIFVASCFGGLLLAKALHLASHIHSKYLGILKSTSGIVFLGTPFRGSHESFYTATDLRLTVAISMAAETSGMLLKYLQSNHNEDDQLEELFQGFCEMVKQFHSKIETMCFYETHRTDFSKIITQLPSSFKDQLKGQTAGILVQQHSASLPGSENLGLPVRHSMLNKYASPQNESFKTVSSTLGDFANKAQKQSRELVSLNNDPIGLQIARWLKSSPIKTEQDEDIDALVFKARMLEKTRDFIKPSPHSILAKISTKAKDDISQGVHGLTVVLETTSSIAERPLGDIGIASEIAEQTISQIRSKVDEVCEGARNGILLSPDIDIDDAMDDNVTAIIDVTPALDLKQHVMEILTPSDSGELHRASINYTTGQSDGYSPQQFRCGRYLQKHPVLVESFPYTHTSGSTEISPDFMLKTKQMIDRLSHPNRTSKHVLPCIGYIQDRYKKQIEVVFSIGHAYDIDESPVSLYDLYKRATRACLGLRFGLAYALAIAVEGLHRVGWVHEELKSKNLMFLTKKQDNAERSTSRSSSSNDLNMDLANPYLLGFGWSRPEEADSDLRTDYSLENNAYHHPERWGKPLSKFAKAHDVYSLGVIFFEIVYWKSISAKLEKLRKEPRLGSRDVKNYILETTRKDVSHMVGRSFADVIETCLEFDQKTKGCDAFETHSIFKEKVVKVLERLVGANV